MEGWDSDTRPVRAGYPPNQVQQYCVQAPYWQDFRLTLKGRTTRDKLVQLAHWYDGDRWAPNSNFFSRYQREVQVGNYLGALRRGGQLDADNNVKKVI